MLDKDAVVTNTQHPPQQPSFVPETSRYYDVINTTFKLTKPEQERLTHNGLLVSDRLAFDSFLTAYAYIYKNDLPVLVTTDSLLHVVHRAYDDMLTNVELHYLSAEFEQLLESLRNHLRQERANVVDPRLQKTFEDLDVYLTVPLVLLTGAACDNPHAANFVKLAKESNQNARIVQFGLHEIPVDFTLFRPRGHYTKNETLQRYFRAISWIQHIQFWLLIHEHGESKAVLEPIAAATLLRNMLDRAGQRQRWHELDNLLNVLIGSSDGMRLHGLDRFLHDAGIHEPSDVFASDQDKLTRLLLSHDYGQQLIGNRMEEPDRPIAYSFFGARYAIDSFILGEVVFDRIVVHDKKVHRPFPKSFDAMYVLGNDRARVHLEDELQRYHYADHLSSLRERLDTFSDEFWQDSFYNRWLTLLRTLNERPEGACPPCMRTDAWADKLLHTQLAAWAELRHDNILYVQQSFTAEIQCDYPAGYVEPYPAFYAALQEYARFGRSVLETYTADTLGMSEDYDWRNLERRTAYTRTLSFFQKLEEVAQQLQTLAEKELRLEAFTAAEETFLKSIVVRTVYLRDNICALVRREVWDGWYYDLFPYQDRESEIIADVHTNLNNNPKIPELLPPGVLHVGTGSVAGMLCLVENAGDSTIYVGPAYTYFETIETGYPPPRLTDEEWRERLSSANPPLPPSWTASFRVPAETQRKFLHLPNTIDVDTT
jgi:hypothetical protein